MWSSLLSLSDSNPFATPLKIYVSFFIGVLTCLFFLHSFLVEWAGGHNSQFPSGCSQPPDLHQCGWRRPRHPWMQPGGALWITYKWNSAAAGQWTCPSTRQPVFSGRPGRGTGREKRENKWISGRSDWKSHRWGPSYEPPSVSQKG